MTSDADEAAVETLLLGDPRSARAEWIEHATEAACPTCYEVHHRLYVKGRPEANRAHRLVDGACPHGRALLTVGYKVDEQGLGSPPASFFLERT